MHSFTWLSHAEVFLDWLGDSRRKKPLESVTTQDARLWREKLQDEGRTGKTVLSYTKDIGAIYRAAILEGLVSFNPFTALEAIDTSDSIDRKPFTGEEVGKLLAAATSEEWRGLILVAGCCRPLRPVPRSSTLPMPRAAARPRWRNWRAFPTGFARPRQSQAPRKNGKRPWLQCHQPTNGESR